MKKSSILPGIILIGFGIYFYLERADIVLFSGFDHWATLMIIIGAGFLIQGYWGKDYDSILPGVILAGLGIHFHIAEILQAWPDHLGAFILILALGFLLRYQKSGTGLSYSIIFFVVAAIHLFYDRILGWLNGFGAASAGLSTFWPLFLVLAGLYFILAKRK